MMMTELHDYKGNLYLYGSRDSVQVFKTINGKWKPQQEAWEFKPLAFIVYTILDVYPDVKIVSPLAKEILREDTGFEIPEIDFSQYGDFVKKSI